MPPKNLFANRMNWQVDDDTGEGARGEGLGSHAHLKVGECQGLMARCTPLDRGDALESMLCQSEQRGAYGRADA